VTEEDTLNNKNEYYLEKGKKKINFLNNQTRYYIKKRKQFLKKMNISYQESKLITFQQKLNYLIIHESSFYKSQMADKILIHEYSKRILGKDICVPIIKTYDKAEEINLNELPNKFVLKCNHGSKMNILCKNKTAFNITKARIRLNRWMKIDYGMIHAEFQYSYIRRKIFLAPYLGDNIIDYEFFCFNGQPKFVRVQKKLDEKEHIYLHNYYDLNWTLTDIETGYLYYKRFPKIKIEKPKNLELMIDYSKKLSEEFAFIRVDFYDINYTIYLSELTFSPSNSLMTFKNKKQSIYLGNLLDISKIKPTLFNK